MRHDHDLERLRAVDPQNPPSDAADLTRMVTSRLATTSAGAQTCMPAPWRRRPVIALAATLLTLTAGTAIAAGLGVPGDVVDSMTPDLRLGTEAIKDCGVTNPLEAAELVASAPWSSDIAALGDGGRVELWVAPTSTGSVYTTVRFVRADDQPYGTNGGCGRTDLDSWTGAAGSLPDADPNRGYAVVYGRTTVTTPRVQVDFATGASVAADVNEDGYYLTVVPGDPRPYTDADGTPVLTPG